MKKLMTIFLFVAILFAACEEPSTTGTVKVTNSTGYSIVVDVNDGNGNWLGERTLYNGNTITYSNVEEGEIDGAARYSDESYWYYTTDYYYLSAGGTVYITWGNKKSGESKSILGDSIPSKGFNK